MDQFRANVWFGNIVWFAVFRAFNSLVFMSENPVSAPPSETTQPARALSLLDATMIVIGSMIGSGIFIVSADVARNLGAPGYVLGAWVVTGIVTLIAALSYGELAGMMPRAGGQYVYLQEAYNPLVGFLFGWTTFLVVETGTIAAVATAFATYTGVLLPWFSADNVLFKPFGLTISSVQLLAVAVIVLLTAINLRGVREAKFVQLIFTLTKTTALLGLVVLGIAVGVNEDFWSLNRSVFWETFRTDVVDGAVKITPLAGWPLLTAIGLAMVGPLFSSSAWNNITFTAAEVKDPRRSIPLSLFFGTLTVSVLYILANVTYQMLLPVKGDPNGADEVARGIMFATNGRVGTAAAAQIFGTVATIIMAMFILISTFGCNNGIILAGARVSYAMARDGLFFRKAGSLNRHGVPGFALGIQCVWAGLLCLSGTYGQLLDYTVFVILIFYILTIGGVFILRRRRPDAPRPYRAFGYPVLPALYMVFSVLLCLDLLWFKPVTSSAGLIIVALGIPVFWLWRRKRAGLRG